MSRILVFKLIHHLQEDLILQMFIIEVLLADKLEGLIDLHVLVVLLDVGLGHRHPGNGLAIHGPEDVGPGGNVLYDQPGPECSTALQGSEIQILLTPSPALLCHKDTDQGRENPLYIGGH